MVLEGEGVFIDDASTQPVSLQFDAEVASGSYVSKDAEQQTFGRDELVALAAAGKFVGTLTARHGTKADVDHPQPAIWTWGPLELQRGRQEFPILHDGYRSMKFSGRHIGNDAHVIVDGRRVSATVSVMNEDETVHVELEQLPPEGMHLLQLQNPNGMFSNDFIFHVAADEKAAKDLDRRIKQGGGDDELTLVGAVSRGNLSALKELLDDDTTIEKEGANMLRVAVRFGQLDIAKFLIAEGVDVQAAGGDGNTPLHSAAFFCHKDIVKLLLAHGGSALQKNRRGQTPIDVVSEPWDEQVAANYTAIGGAIGLEGFELDLDRIQRERPLIVQLLRDDSVSTGAPE